MLRPDGTVFATGVNACGGPGHTAIYYPNKNPGVSGFWKAAQNIPGVNDMADAPAAVLPDGNVLVQTSPGINAAPSTFYEFELKSNAFLPTRRPLPRLLILVVAAPSRAACWSSPPATYYRRRRKQSISRNAVPMSLVRLVSKAEHLYLRKQLPQHFATY